MTIGTLGGAAWPRSACDRLGSDGRGRVQLMDFWLEHCATCIMESKALLARGLLAQAESEKTARATIQIFMMLTLQIGS